MIHKINIAEKFALITEYWSPKVIGELNGQHVKLVKLKGPFTWHHHEQEDELFFVIQGVLKMEFRDGTLELHSGEMCTVPKGIEHRPIADAEVLVMLFEPANTLNTGNVINHFTKESPENI